LGTEGLDFQLVSVDFTGGLDTRTNPKLRVPGKWDLLTNCVHSKDGSLSKRDGVRALVPDVNGHGLATFDAELLAINGTSVYSAKLQPSVGAVKVAGQIPCLHVEKQEIARATNAHDQVDCAYGNGLEVYVWRERNIAGVATLGIYFCAIDTETRAYVIQPTRLTSTAGYFPRVVFVSDAFMFLWVEVIGAKLNAAVYSTTSGSVGPATDLGVVVGLGPGTVGIDAVGFGFDGVTNFVRTAAVSYIFTDGVTSVRCSQVTYSEVTLVPAIMATANLITEAALPHAGICGLGMGLTGGLAGAGAYATTFVASPAPGLGLAGVAGAAVNDAWAASPATLIDGGAIFGAAQATHVVATRYPVAGSVSACQVYVDGFADIGGVGGTGVRPLRSYSVVVVSVFLPLVVVDSRAILNSAVNATAAVPQGPFIAGSPMVISPPVGGIFSYPETIALPVYLASGTAGIIQSGLYLVDGNTGAVLGKSMYGQHDSRGIFSPVPSTPRRTNAPTVARAGLASFVLPFVELGRLTLLGYTNFTPSGVAALIVTPNLPASGTNAADAWAPRRTQIGRAAMIANGMLAMYDGAAVCEADFNMFPEGLNITRAAGGGTWTAGTYSFVAVYEWVDGQGQRHQSAPSPVVQLAITLNDTVTFRVPTLMLTQRSNIKHVLYGTQPNGTTFTRFGTLTTPIEIANDKTLAQSVTVVLAEPPASNELLYSQPFVADTTLPNDAPGPCSIVGVHQQRLWLDLMDRDGAFRYSQQLVSGVGLQFNELLGGQLPVEAGKITGFASMDEMMVIFAERKLFRITGTGPTPSGGYNGYSDPVEIPSDVGCTTPSSVLRIPDGVMFRSAKGWYLLTRDLSVKYIGGPIKRWDTDVITSAVLMEDRQEIRISSRRTYDPSFSGALQFCYSYVADTWSVFQVTSLTVTPIVSNCLQVFDAVWWPTTGRYVSIGYYDGINQDTPGTYLDWVGTNVAGFAIGMSARSSFLHLAALEGFQRVRWLYLTASGPTAPATQLSFRVDFDDLYQTQNPPGAPGCYLTSPLTLTAIPFANPAAVDLRHKLRRQKCKSVAITVNETPVSAGAAGLTGFQAMALQIGVRRGTNKLPAAQGVP
jgi:hypothetical protein